MINRYSINRSGRDIIVGDIHGHFSRLNLELEKINFDYKVDRLFSVGDLVDRGPESENVLEWLDCDWFHAVRGNHEDMAIAYTKNRDLSEAQHAQLTRNYVQNGGSWFMSLPRDMQDEISIEFQRLPMGIEIETSQGLVCIVHADIPSDNWQDLKELLLGTPNLQTIADVTAYLMWSRERVNAADTTGIKDIRALVVGHTPMKKAGKLGNVILIDTRGWHAEGESGNFTFLSAEHLEILRPTATPMTQ